MNRPIFLLFMLMAFNAVAQVISRGKNSDGSVNNYIRMQFGPDTIQMGKPFKPLDKIGMMISIRRTNTGNSLMLDCRSKDPLLSADSIDILKSYLLFVLNKGDTIKLTPVPGRYNTKFERLQGGTYFFFRANLSDPELKLLSTGKLGYIHLSVSDLTCVELPSTKDERKRFKRAIADLL